MAGIALVMAGFARAVSCAAAEPPVRALFLLDAAGKALEHGGIETPQWAEEYGVEEGASLFGDDAPTQAIVPTSRVEQRIDALLTVDLGATTLRFRDVRRDAWFAPYVRSAAERGIVQGYRDAPGGESAEYRPERPVSVEELAKVALSARGIGVPCAVREPVNRSGSGGWSAAHIACAEVLQWSLFSDASVDVRRPATRAEVVLTMLQAFAVQMAAVDPGAKPRFTDVPPSLLFAQVIERAAQDGIVTGYVNADGTTKNLFGPQDPVSRAQLAKIVMLAIERYGKP